MTQVAKLVLIDNQDKYLLLYRSDHPIFGADPDIAGGTIEEGESPLEGMIREVYEEIGVKVSESAVHQVYEGKNYSAYETDYVLYVAKFDHRPDINMSWEHSAFEWIEREDFLQKAKDANDNYMHMVHGVLK